MDSIFKRLPGNSPEARDWGRSVIADAALIGGDSALFDPRIGSIMTFYLDQRDHARRETLRAISRKHHDPRVPEDGIDTTWRWMMLLPDPAAARTGARAIDAALAGVARLEIHLSWPWEEQPERFSVIFTLPRFLSQLVFCLYRGALLITAEPLRTLDALQQDRGTGLGLEWEPGREPQLVHMTNVYKACGALREIGGEHHAR